MECKGVAVGFKGAKHKEFSEGVYSHPKEPSRDFLSLVGSSCTQRKAPFFGGDFIRQQIEISAFPVFSRQKGVFDSQNNSQPLQSMCHTKGAAAGERSKEGGHSKCFTCLISFNLHSFIIIILGQQIRVLK